MRRLSLFCFIFFLANSAFSQEITGFALALCISLLLCSFMSANFRTRITQFVRAEFGGTDLESAQQRVDRFESIAVCGVLTILCSAGVGVIGTFTPWGSGAWSWSVALQFVGYAVAAVGYGAAWIARRAVAGYSTIGA